MSTKSLPPELIQPPADVPEIQRGDWFPLPTPDPVTDHLAAQHWEHPQAPRAWEVARLSQAAYVYRETATGWSVVVKFYAVKTGDKAERYAAREFECTQRARASGLSGADMRAIRPLSAWRGGLFLEYVDGLTLEDIIAVRRSRPGTLGPSLERAAQLLATLHAQSAPDDDPPHFSSAASYTREIVHDLVRWGVLESDPIVRDGLLRSIGRWERHPPMNAFEPTLTHGDATTTNFIFPPEDGDGIVAIDWERLYPADPAADLGRLMAEVSHSITQHGGSVAEAVPFVRQLVDAYRRAHPKGDADEVDALLKRTRFYQASSTLRIARNGWVSRLDRTALVAQALVHLDR